MAMRPVDGYQANLGVTRGRHFINLYRNRRQVGRINTSDTLMFQTAVDLLRNEGPNIYWNDEAEILVVGLEPVGEEES